MRQYDMGQAMKVLRTFDNIESLPLCHAVNANYHWVIVQKVANANVFLSKLHKSNCAMSRPIWSRNSDSARLFSDVRLAGVTARFLIANGSVALGELNVWRVDAPPEDKDSKFIALYSDAVRNVRRVKK